MYSREIGRSICRGMQISFLEIHRFFLLLKSPIETNGMVRIAIEFVAVLVVLEMVSMWALGETLARTSEF